MERQCAVNGTPSARTALSRVMTRSSRSATHASVSYENSSMSSRWSSAYISWSNSLEELVTPVCSWILVEPQPPRDDHPDHQTKCGRKEDGVAGTNPKRNVADAGGRSQTPY